MSIGIGLFLGLVFCGFVYLYTQTKDRWNWSKARKIIFYLLTTPILLGLILWVGFFSYEKYQERPKVITEFQGIKLGEKFQDVTFKLGTLAGLDELAQKYGGKIASKETQVIVNKTTDGDYFFNSFSARLTIKDNKVEDIKHVCDSSYDSNSINDIGCGSTGDKILDKFGTEVRVLCGLGKDDAKNMNARVYDVVKYGTRYYLTKNSVDGLLVTSPVTLESMVGVNWGKCN